MRNYFKLSLKRDFDRYKRGAEGGAPLLLVFFDGEDFYDVERAWGEFMKAYGTERAKRGAGPDDLLVSVWRRPDWEGPWQAVPVVGSFAMGVEVDEGRAA